MTVGGFFKYLTSISLRHTNILYKSGSLLTEKFVGVGGIQNFWSHGSKSCQLDLSPQCFFSKFDGFFYKCVAMKNYRRHTNNTSYTLYFDGITNVVSFLNCFSITMLCLL